MTKVIIDVSGGLVQAVYTRNENVEVEVIDWDEAEVNPGYEKWANKIWKEINNSKTYKNIY